MTKRQLEIIISALPRFNKLYSLNINSFNYENLKKLNIISNTLKHLLLMPNTVLNTLMIIKLNQIVLKQMY